MTSWRLTGNVVLTLRNNMRMALSITKINYMRKSTMLLAMMAAISVPAMAVTVGTEVDLTSTLKGKVVRENGNNHDVEVYSNPDNKPTGAVEIKAVYFIGDNNYSVTAIANDAFKNNDQITSVSVGLGVTSIGSYAFRGCTKMASFTQAGDGEIETIGANAFEYTSSLKSVSFPKVEFVGNFSFLRCGAESVSMPEIRTISPGAFQECQKLVSFTGGEKLRQVGNIAFTNSSLLSGIALGPELTSIGTTAFGYITDLSSIVIPKNLELADRDAFSGTGLKTVYILSDKIMDYCQESKLLQHQALGKVYCVDAVLEDVKNFLKTSYEADSFAFPADVEVASVTALVDLIPAEKKDTYTVKSGSEEIQSLKLYDVKSGKEITPVNGVYTIAGETVGMSYRIGANLLDYTHKISVLSSGVGSVITGDGTSAAPEYYSIDGVRLTGPAKGIYIERTSKGSRVKIGK